jgi:heterodisulfide reductase subunit A
LLKPQGIATETAKSIPVWVDREGGSYVAIRGERGWSGNALILAPRDAAEARRLFAAFGEDGSRPRIKEEWDGVNTHLPGVYYCDPALDPDLVGSAAAARACAWLGRVENRIVATASVDPLRCRACGTCVEICEFGAPKLVGEGAEKAAHIDPMVCVGCGTCSVHCPSGAIHQSQDAGAELASALTAILAAGD